MNIPKLAATTFDGDTWGGWSNSKGDQQLKSLKDAVSKIKADPELGHIIIDADNLKIWVSDMVFSERAVRSAKVNFGVDISDIIIGFPF